MLKTLLTLALAGLFVPSIGRAQFANTVISYRIDVLSGRTQIDAISAVPEPAGWKVGLAGAAVLWIGSRVKRKGAKLC